jgi:hypothetical protein
VAVTGSTAGSSVPLDTIRLKSQRPWILLTPYSFRLRFDVRRGLLPSALACYFVQAWRHEGEIRNQRRRLHRLFGKTGISNEGKCANPVVQASYFCFPCTLAQMETEVKDRAALLQHSGGKPEGYSQPQGGMAYQQPGQPAPAYQNGKY